MLTELSSSLKNNLQNFLVNNWFEHFVLCEIINTWKDVALLWYKIQSIGWLLKKYKFRADRTVNNWNLHFRFFSAAGLYLPVWKNIDGWPWSYSATHWKIMYLLHPKMCAIFGLINFIDTQFLWKQIVPFNSSCSLLLLSSCYLLQIVFWTPSLAL